MGPKKKGGKSSKGGKGSGGIIDGVAMEEMSREQLEKFTLRIRDELEREREERNFFQLERDKLRTFWEITRQKLEESKSEIRNKERALEEADEKHQAEIKVFNEKIKHLMYEHQCRLTEVKAENMIALKLAQEEYNKQEAILIEDKEQLKKQIVSTTQVHEEELRDIQKKHGEQLFGIREELMKKIEEMAIKAEKRLETIRDYFEMKNKMEMVELEERKNDLIHQLDKNQAKQLSEMRSYFRGVTDNNLLMISSLKEELTTMKAEKVKMKNTIEKLKNENSALVKPLEEAKEKMALMEKQLADYKKNKSSLFEMHKRFSALSRKLEDIISKNDALEIAIEKLEFEKDELRAHYTTMIVNIEKDSALKIGFLEKKNSAFESELERREIQMAHILSKSNLEPKAVIHATNKIQQAMVKREKKMEKLKIEFGKLVRSHDEMLDFFVGKAKEYNIQTENLPFCHYKPIFQQIITDSLDERLVDFSWEESSEYRKTGETEMSEELPGSSQS